MDKPKSKMICPTNIVCFIRQREHAMQRDMVPLVFLSDVHTPDRVKPMNSGARIKDKSPPLTSGIHIKPDDSVAEVFDWTLSLCWATRQAWCIFLGEGRQVSQGRLQHCSKERVCNSLGDVDAMTAKPRGGKSLQGGTCSKKGCAPEKPSWYCG